MTARRFGKLKIKGCHYQRMKIILDGSIMCLVDATFYNFAESMFFP